MARDKIVIAGATGFIGHAVARRLARRSEAPFEIVGLTRGRKEATGAWDRLVTCDLFSLRDLVTALEGARYAAYFVHSMLPSARLVQSAFQDLDLICADNFGRAAAHHKVEQIVYLGGLIPPARQLSAHLASRREVERALSAHDVAVTTLRAAMVIGARGSSFDILTQLVRRLPAMVLPHWAAQQCQPIDLDTIAELIAYVVGRHGTYGETYDVGGPDVLTYGDMLRVVGEQLGTPRPTISVPLMTPGLSRLWISLITGAPRSLVAPLVESLHFDMTCQDQRLQDAAGLRGRPFREAVASALAAERDAGSGTPHAYQPAPRAPVTGVRSVQRIALPRGRDAEWAAHEFMRWLPRGIWPPVRVEVDHERTCTFLLPRSRIALLELTFDAERSACDRQLFHVTGGLLAGPSSRGRLEFRVSPDGEHLLAAIHDYVPRLPWWLYLITQAHVHRWVMSRFGRHLAALADEGHELGARVTPSRLECPDHPAPRAASVSRTPG